MSNFNLESVLSVHHWTDTLFSFTTTRDPSFRFRNGEFTMIGLKVGERPLLRAYSVASANYEGRLEFFSIKVPDGPLTSRLQHLKQGDEIIVSRKATGTLVIDNLEDGRNLYLIGTGTGYRRSSASSRIRRLTTASKKWCCCTVAAASPNSPMAR
jgi:ferredoxin--NADP+ reductase